MAHRGVIMLTVFGVTAGVVLLSEAALSLRRGGRCRLGLRVRALPRAVLFVMLVIRMVAM